MRVVQRINFIDQRCGHPSGKSASHNANCRGGKLASVHASRHLDQQVGFIGGVLASAVASVFVGNPATRSRQQAVRLFGTLAGVVAH